MPFLFAVVGGAALAWWLIETDRAIPAFIGLWVLIILMFAWPAAAGWLFAAFVALALLALLATFWMEVAGVVLGVITFFFLMLAFLSILAR